VWIILFGLFWFDATLTLLRRKLNGEKLSQAHRKHAYQRITQSGWSHRKVVIWSIAVNVLLLLVILLIPNILASFVTTILLLYIIIKFVDYKKAFE
jgi:Fuc2NAc and GlcNAc transferase